MIAPAQDRTRSLHPCWTTGSGVDDRALAEWAGPYALDRVVLTGAPGLLVECPHRPGVDIARSATPTQGELQSGSAFEVRIILGTLQAAYILISGFGARRAILCSTHAEETPSSSAASVWERSSTEDNQQRWLQAGSDLVRVLTATSATDRSPALIAFDELRDWLHLPIPDVARLVGVSRSAPMYWRRQMVAPRPSVAGTLYRLHALVRALRDAVPTEPPLAILQRRPAAGGPSAYDLLCAGQYDEAERLLRPLIFPTPDQPPHRRLIAWDEDVEPSPATELTLRPPVRRARRVTLTT